MEDEEELNENKIEDEYDDNEINNEIDIDDEKKDNNIKTTNYEIIKNSEIIKKRDVIIEKFVECSCLNYDEAELVLVNYNWNYDKLTEEWFDKTDKIKIESHIEQSPESLKNIIKFNPDLSDKICPVCYCELEEDNSLFLKCYHKICKECYIEYIQNKLKTEPLNILFTFCPLKGCNLYLTRTIYRKCITEKKMQIIFAKSIISNFIQTNKNIKICPNPSCNYSIKSQDNLPKEIKCKCGTLFCFSCLKESHIPCSCDMINIWNNIHSELRKSFGEEIDEYEENFLWVNKNTKKCPNCGVTIEKNQGCNHMTCRRESGGCGYEFCWICLNNWYNHNFKGCTYDVKENEKTMNKTIKKLLNEDMDNYIKYFSQWKEMEQKDEKFYDKIQERIDDLKEDLEDNKGVIEADLNFLDEALKNIIECNRYLKYNFIFGYFLNDQANIKLFEFNYQFLRNQNDLLLELIELGKLPKIIAEKDKNIFHKKFIEYKDGMLSSIKLIQTYKTNLINEIDNNLFDKIDYDKIYNKLKLLNK